MTLLFVAFAWAHFRWVRASLVALSPDGSVALFEVREGDTEGGADGELLVLCRLDEPVRPARASDSKATAGPLASQVVLPYEPSHGAGAEHDPADVQAAPERRRGFFRVAREEHGVTEQAASRRVDGGGVAWTTPSGPLAVDYGGGPGTPIVLSLGERSASVPAPAPDAQACVVALWRTDESHTFVAQLVRRDPAAAPECIDEMAWRVGPTSTFTRLELVE